MLLLSSDDIFQNHFFFSKNSFRYNIRVSNSLDPDQDRHSVGPDLGPNCLKKLSVPPARNISLILTILDLQEVGPDLHCFQLFLEIYANN